MGDKMYIQTLELENFKCFDHMTLDLHPELTVIVGNNGSGKTSILEAAAIAISTMFVKMDGISGRSIDKSQMCSKQIIESMVILIVLMERLISN